MTGSGHDSLLAAAVEAQERYERTVENAKEARRAELQRVVDGGLSARQVARVLGKSPSWVTRILKGSL